MKTTKISHVAHLVELCSQYGISQVVVSPGSRNAPIVIALDVHPQIEVFLVHDERSAAFFAMGLAEESGSPVAITCTSGSAPLNYAPAIAEAYYRNIPLLVLTADRPVAMVDQGDGQTIRQKHVFANYIKADFELPDYPKGEKLVESDAIVNEALNQLVNQPQGPVQINIPLTEPLYETQDLEIQPILNLEECDSKDLSAGEKELIASEWQKATKKLVLIGQMKSGELNTELLKPLLADPGVAILVENTSNIQNFQRICHCIDRTLAIIKPDEIADFAPDLLVTFGGAVISKKIKAFLRNNKPAVNWRIGEHAIEQDTYQSLTQSFYVKPYWFIRFIGTLDLVPNSNFGSKWKQRDFMAEDRHFNYLSNATFSDLKAFESILDTMPEDTNLHMANSSVVRYCQLFNPVRGMKYYANRGVSGIDGSSSTALGIAVASSKRLNLLISGDISFFYDSNALWNNYLVPNLRIIVINNGGGGIFKIIDGPSQSEQANYFFAPFKASVKAICEAFNVRYRYANTLESLESQFYDFYSITADNRPEVFEIDTHEVENESILKAYFQAVGNSI